MANGREVKSQVVEAFRCPDGHLNYVEWGETERTRVVPCVVCRHDTYTPPPIEQQGTDPATGNPIYVETGPAVRGVAGHLVTCTRRGGEKGEEREMNIAGSWARVRDVTIEPEKER